MENEKRELLLKIRGAFNARGNFYGSKFSDFYQKQKVFVHGLIVAYRIVYQEK